MDWAAFINSIDQREKRMTVQRGEEEVGASKKKEACVSLQKEKWDRYQRFLSAKKGGDEAF